MPKLPKKPPLTKSQKLQKNQDRATQNTAARKKERLTNASELPETEKEENNSTTQTGKTRGRATSKDHGQAPSGPS